MFQTSTEAMLIADAATRRVTDVNPAGEDMLRRVARRLVGSTLDELVLDEHANAVSDCAAAARAMGQSSCSGMKTAADLRRCVAVRLAAARRRTVAAPRAPVVPAAPRGPGTSALGDAWGALSHLPEAMVTATGDLDIIEANEAFLDLVDVATANQIRSESLARFVGRHGVDMNVLTSRLQDNGSIRRYATVLRGQYGAVRDVELTAAMADRDEKRVYAFLFRPVVAERSVLGDVRRPLRPVSEMTDLVGRVPLRDIVREATDIIEELCIEAALAVTQDNRASAAEMLGAEPPEPVFQAPPLRHRRPAVGPAERGVTGSPSSPREDRTAPGSPGRKPGRMRGVPDAPRDRLGVLRRFSDRLCASRSPSRTAPTRHREPTIAPGCPAVRCPVAAPESVKSS